MSDQIELRAAAARLMYNDNRDIRDYYMLIDFIDMVFSTSNQILSKIERLEEILTAMDAAGKEERKDE